MLKINIVTCCLFAGWCNSNITGSFPRYIGSNPLPAQKKTTNKKKNKGFFRMRCEREKLFLRWDVSAKILNLLEKFVFALTTKTIFFLFFFFVSVSDF